MCNQHSVLLLKISFNFCELILAAGQIRSTCMGPEEIADNFNNQIMNCRNFITLRDTLATAQPLQYLSEETLLCLKFLKRSSEVFILQHIL